MMLDYNEMLNECWIIFGLDIEFKDETLTFKEKSQLYQMLLTQNYLEWVEIWGNDIDCNIDYLKLLKKYITEFVESILGGKEKDNDFERCDALTNHQREITLLILKQNKSLKGVA